MSGGDGFDETMPAQRGPAGAAPASASPAPSLLRGDSHRFLRGAEHARGGIGRVVNARDVVLDRDVVVKELLSEREGHRARFEREALITARLQHPSIVPIYDAGIGDDGQPFYAMKKVEGESLRDRLAAASDLGKRLSLVPTVLAVAEAVAYAHSRGIIHRDLKPANVMVGAYGETLVVDWGLAKDLRAAAEPGLGQSPPSDDLDYDETIAGEVMGTPSFMAPEQARGERVDERADVYALGAILYQLLSGHSPHAGTSGAEVLASARTGEKTPIAELVPEVPAELAEIVDTAMASEPAHRFADAGALAVRLADY